MLTTELFNKIRDLISLKNQIAEAMTYASTDEGAESLEEEYDEVVENLEEVVEQLEEYYPNFRKTFNQVFETI